MEDIVHGILAHRVSVGIEETECCIFCQLTHPHTHRSTQRHTEVGARVNGQADLVDIVLRIGSGLGSSNWALVVRITDLELIKIGGEWLQLGCFDLVNSMSEFPKFSTHSQLAYLNCIVNVGTRVYSTFRCNLLEALIFRHLVLQANRSIRHGPLLLCTFIP
jgi:hypothetical protein